MVSSFRALAEMEETLRNYDGYLVYFSTIAREYLPNLEDLRDELPLQVVFEADDGSVFTIAE